MHDAIIIGGGPAGLNAALVLGRAQRRVLLCDNGEPRNRRVRQTHGFLPPDGVAPAELRSIAGEQLSRYPAVEARRVRVERIDRRATSFRATLIDGDTGGARRVLLGLWVGPSTSESSKFWLTVLSELKTRGVADVCIVCWDGLTGLPDAINVIWPAATVQLCVVHLIRASLRCASKRDWTQLTKDLRLIYTAANDSAAEVALDAFAETWSTRYPTM